MALAKLKFNAGEEKKLIVAAWQNNIELMTEPKPAGKVLVVEVRYREPQNLIDLARAVETVTGNELDSVTPKKKLEPSMAN